MGKKEIVSFCLDKRTLQEMDEYRMHKRVSRSSLLEDMWYFHKKGMDANRQSEDNGPQTGRI